MPRKIIVDADACPVKNEIVTAASLFGVEAVLVASHDHRLDPAGGATVIQVDASDQSVDLHIANQLRKGDVLITQDFGLATIGLSKQAVVLSNHGQRYTDETIPFLLARRHEQAKLRRSGKRTKGPKAFTDDDRQRFSQTLTNILKDLQEFSSM